MLISEGNVAILGKGRKRECGTRERRESRKEKKRRGYIVIQRRSSVIGRGSFLKRM